MKKVYHILNGDALKSRFPGDLEGERIIFRECLVDGDAEGGSKEAFYQTRARFISKAYKGFTEVDYFATTVPELEKILHIGQEAEVNLWFEDDLFCQVNCWYVFHCLQKQHHRGALYLVRPFTDLLFGFAALDQNGLKDIFQKRRNITQKELSKLSALWENHLSKNDSELLKIANELTTKYPFLLPVIKAEIDRRAPEGVLGRPEQSLKVIMNELGTKDFEPIFRAFSERESIYGFGDVQVRRMLENLT